MPARPAEPWRLTVVEGGDWGARAAARTSSGPVDGCKRGSAIRRPTMSSAASAEPAHRTRRFGSCLTRGEGPAAVLRRDPIHIRGAELRHRVALDLDHVLRVLLTAVRELEAARVHVIVRDN